MSSVDSLSYTSEVSNDSSSGSDNQDTSINQGATKKSKSKRNKVKGKWRKKNDFNYLNNDTTSKLLSKKEFQSSFEKIVDLLDYDGLISEIKAGNEALVTFLSTTATLQVLICLVIETIEFPSDMEVDSQKFKYKFPSLISEILSLECLSLANSGALNDDTLNLLFSFLRKPDKDLETSRVNVFANVATTFSQLYEETILDFVQRNPWILDSLLNKIHFYPLANFLLQLHLPSVPFTEGCDSSAESVQEMTIHCCYVNDYFLLHKLSEKFVPSSLSHLDEFERQEAIHNAAFVFLGLTLRTIPFREYIAIPPELDILCEISLLGTLLSVGLEEANNNLECLNDSWHSPVLVHGLTIIYEVLGALLIGSKTDRWNSDFHYSTALLLQCVQQGMWECSKDAERLISEIESEIVPKFGQLANLLTMHHDDQQKDQLKQKPRLGGLRLKIAEFFMICLVTCSKDTMIEIFNLQVPQWLLTTFVECDMCNILQHQVSLLLSCALQKTETDLNLCQKLWILECRLFPWFIDAWELNFVSERQHRMRKGYMGHLIPLGNILATLLDDYEHELVEIIDDEVLSSFERIRNNDLQIENEIQSKEIGGSHPVYSNEERKSTKLQVDTLGVDFDQLMGGIMSSDAATIQIFSEYLYEDEESPVDEEDVQEDDKKRQVGNEEEREEEEEEEGLNNNKRVDNTFIRASTRESSLSNHFAQMLAMNASDIVPISNRKLSLEKNNKPHRESFEKLVDKNGNKEKDIFEDDSFLWAGNDEEGAKDGFLLEEEEALTKSSTRSETAFKSRNSSNFVKRRTLLSTNQLIGSTQSSLQQPSVICRDDEGHAIGTLRSSGKYETKNQETKSPNGLSHEMMQPRSRKLCEKKEEVTSEKGKVQQVSYKKERDAPSPLPPQLLNQDFATKTLLNDGKSSIISNTSKPYRRKKEIEGIGTTEQQQVKEPPVWQKDNSDVFSTLVRNLLQTSFTKSNSQSNRSRKKN